MNSYIGKYRPSDRMADLINDNYRLLQVMSRFGLPLGFGEKSVQEVCKLHQVDTHTFLAVVNFLQDDHELMHDDVENISIESLLHYLKRAHNYFLDFSLPSIRQKLFEAISDDSTSKEIVILILKFFDEFVAEVHQHMEFENLYEFTYVNHLIRKEIDKAEEVIHQVCPLDQYPAHTDTPQENIYQSGEKSNILLFTHKHSLQHEQIDEKLSELKKILIKYYPASTDNLLLNAVLFDIFNCEQDLIFHCKVEDYLFVPAVNYLEKQCGI